jgi:integrative and conjugative element protein (TIGR02256 family)
VTQFAWRTEGEERLLRATLPAKVLDEMLEMCRAAGKRETGGILIGRHSEDRSTAVILEATGRPKDSLFSWVTFSRGSQGLRALLERRWAENSFYLGEWHFHPGGSPNPSHQDILSMKKIASDPDYQCPLPLLLIVGGNPRRDYPVSCTVFLGDHKAVSMIADADNATPAPGHAP